MENLRILLLASLFVIGSFFASSSQAQTDSYTCNVVCFNQPDLIMSDVKVDLFDVDGQFLATTYTNEEGFFTFENLLIGNSYTAKFSYDRENNYVDLADAYTLLSYLNGDTDLNEIQLLAANVNGDEVVNNDDFWYILFNYYILEQPFPIGDWVFQDWEFTLDGSKASGGPSYGASSGNVNTNDDDDDKSLTELSTIYTNIEEIQDLNETSIPIYLDQANTISGLGLVMEFNNEIFDIASIESPIEELEYNVDGNQIRIGWTSDASMKFDTEEAILNIQMKQKEYTSMEQIERFEIMEETHILDAKGNKTLTTGFTTNEFKTAVKTEIISTAYPNPCSDYFYLPIENDVNQVQLSIHNSLGQLIRTTNYTNQNGQIQVNTQGLKTGLYYYQVNYQSKSITGPISIQ